MTGRTGVEELRILYFISTYAPGQGSSSLHEDYVRALARAGHEVVVAALDPKPRGGPYLREQSAGDTRLVHVACSRGASERALNFASARLFRYPFFLTGLLGYRSLLARERFDVLHVETAFPLGAIVAAAGAPRRPQVLTPQGEDLIVEPAYDYGHRRFAAPRALVRRSLRRAEVVRCIAPLVVDEVRSAGGDESRCVVVPCNVRADAIPADVRAFRDAARARLRPRLGAGREAPFVLAFGRLHPFKGLDALVRALGVLRRQGSALAAAVIGGSKHTDRFGDYRDFLRRLAAEEGLADVVVFPEEVPNDEAAAVLAAADLVVVPSTTESFNRVSIEAAAVGTPVVVTRTTGISAWLATESFAVVAEGREPEVLAAAIRRALGLGDAALEAGPAFARRFLPDRIAAEMEPLYRRASQR